MEAELEVGWDTGKGAGWEGGRNVGWRSPGVCRGQAEMLGCGQASPPERVVNWEPRRVSDQNTISRIQGPSKTTRPAPHAAPAPGKDSSISGLELAGDYDPPPPAGGQGNRGPERCVGSATWSTGWAGFSPAPEPWSNRVRCLRRERGHGAFAGLTSLSS